MTEIVAAHLERVASETVSGLWHNDSHGVQSETVCVDPEACRRCRTESRVAAALAACAREASEKLEPYCRHLNSCAAFPASSKQQIERDCDCGLIKALRALERAVGEKG